MARPIASVLDGAMGSELDRRGLIAEAPFWSARAIDEAPDAVAEVHRAYAAAGADVHTTNTFRTQPHVLPNDWERLARRAVALAREVTGKARVAGSLAPHADCYEPAASPGEASRASHRALAEVLADAGCDLLLCETFPNVDEAVIATEEAVRTGLPTWTALTAGPSATLLAPAELAEGARRIVDRGAAIVLVNCIAAARSWPYVEALAATGLPFGAYANAGATGDGLGWDADDDEAAERYASLARTWLDAGASVVGGCCGTRPAHIRALREEVDRRAAR